MKLIDKFDRSEKGQGLVEYGLILALVSVVAVGTLGGVGDKVTNSFNSTVLLMNKDYDKVVFGQLKDIPTNVQDFKGRNLLLGSDFIHNTGFYYQGIGSGMTGDIELQGGSVNVAILSSTRGSDVSLKQHINGIDMGNDSHLTLSTKVTEVRGDVLSKILLRSHDNQINYEYDHPHFSEVGLASATLKLSDGYTPTDIWLSAYPKSIGDIGSVSYIEPKLEKGTSASPYQPAPEDLKFAKSYSFDESISLGNTYTLSADFTADEWVGVWLGKNHFVGYFEDGILTFDGIDGVDDVIIKSISPKTTMENVQLEIVI